ncbi:MAG: type II toxin-antitoxin system RelE/ParE family toxin [Proteobacteria bacterium]|nr:type II toxin-antitoxin system RelE/ParE family toxin [Pseudomonadota bacterium]
MRETRVTVVETKAFTGRAKGRMSAAEVDRAIEVIARDPLCGDLIQGTGGIRKVRFAVKGRGKSGGVRIVYYYYNESIPVFLLTVFAKNEKADLARAERNALGKVARALRESYGA